MTATILVGVSPDSPAAQRAVDWAATRATSHQQAIRLLAVVDGTEGAVGAAAVITDAAAAMQEELDSEVERLREQGLEATAHVEHGSPVARLTEASAAAALLVIGSDYKVNGETARGVHGTRIAAAAHCPVVVVPEAEPSSRAGVVVGVDGTETSAMAVAFAAAEADRQSEPLMAVTVWTPLALPRRMRSYPPHYLESLEEMAEESLSLSLAGLAQHYPDLRVQRRVERGHPAAGISRYGTSAVLTVVGSHGRGTVTRFLLGSVSEEVLRRPPGVTAVVR